MGSYQQIIVGGMLLVTAFFFGRFVINRPSGQLNGLNTMARTDGDSGDLKLQAESGAVNSGHANDANSLQRTLRERILGERNQKVPAAATSDSSANAIPENPLLPPPQLSENATVVPDFSHLELASAASAPPEHASPQRLPPREIASIDRKPTPYSEGPSDRSRVSGNDLLAENRSEVRAFSEEQPAPTRFSINRKPMRNEDNPDNSDVLAPEIKLVPVQRKQSQLILENREYVSYTTVFGDTLHSLSTKFFASPDYYLDIYLANRELLKNPSDVPVNTTIRIPVLRSAEKLAPVD